MNSPPIELTVIVERTYVMVIRSYQILLNSEDAAFSLELHAQICKARGQKAADDGTQKPAKFRISI